MAQAKTKWFTVFLNFLKPIGLFAGGLYLLGFGLFPFAHPDLLLPFEQGGCFVLGCSFLLWFAISYFRFYRFLRSGKV